MTMVTMMTMLLGYGFFSLRDKSASTGACHHTRCERTDQISLLSMRSDVSVQTWGFAHLLTCMDCTSLRVFAISILTALVCKVPRTHCDSLSGCVSCNVKPFVATHEPLL